MVNRNRIAYTALLSFASILFTAGLAPPISAADRPNVVLILADDLGYETVGCYGGTSYATPNIDRLATEGIRFDCAYAMPLCTNTRIQLMTGKYNIRNWKAFGILDPQAKTFGHLMQSAGYKTCIAGKWQLSSYDPPDYPGAKLRRNTGMQVADAGFDSYSLWHTGHTEDKGPRYANPVIQQNGRMLSDTQGKYGPDIWTDFIGEFMEKHREEPFFVYYSMALPHNPMNPTPDSPEWKDPAQRHDDITRYAADMIEYTDKMVGKVVARVDELGLRENTLILFFSDNGTNRRVRSKFRGQMVNGEKGKGTELGVRVPMIASWKGAINANQVSNALIDSVDFLPTVLDATSSQVIPPDDLDGISFMPILASQAVETRQHVFIHQDPRPGWDKDRFRAIRLAINDQFKLYEDGRMFDVVSDFFERQAIWPNGDTDQQRAARLELEAVLRSYSSYDHFNPSQVPRSDPNAVNSHHAFQDQGGYVVVEAEQIPIPRDEAWYVEHRAPGYTGLGYLRSVRQQADMPQRGVSTVAVNIDSEGPYKLAVRCRSDTTHSDQEKMIWIRQVGGRWEAVALAKTASPGEWHWATMNGDESFELDERRNEFEIAPHSHNVKIDRIVVYREQYESVALDPLTPVSTFEPW